MLYTYTPSDNNIPSVVDTDLVAFDVPVEKVAVVTVTMPGNNKPVELHHTSLRKHAQRHTP